MKKLSIVIILLAAAAFAQTPPPPPPPSVELPPELDRVLRDYEKFWRAKNARSLASLFTDDGFVLSSGRPPVRGRAAIREAYAQSGGPLFLRAFAFSTDGATGHILGGFRDAESAPDGGKFVLVLRKVAGKWLIVADMDNANQRPRAPQPPAPPTAPSPPKPPSH